MRIYLPSTLPALAAVLEDGEVRGAPFTAYAATDELRSALGADDEELEYEALHHAAAASLRLLAADAQAPRRRVVIAADVPGTIVQEPADDDGPAAVTVTGTVPLNRVASAHVDDAGAVDGIAAALAEPGAGHEDGHELMWYATQELKYLVDEE
ncbi:MAG: hypothetical protein M0026_15790 [Nocardiopsaceae bacterium]|nr:hypothetical protein [Nocardiopsaceae bacterium]